MTRTTSTYLLRDEGAWALQHLKLSDSAINAWRGFVEGLLDAFLWAFDNNIDIETHDLNVCGAETRKLANGHKVISLDPCVPGDYNIGASRIYLPGGVAEMGIQERPGFKTLKEQIAEIPKGKDYALIEDDVFSGGTISRIIRMLNEEGITIAKLVVGIQVGRPQLPVKVTPLKEYDPTTIVDLNDCRDFLAGAFNAGLVFHYPDHKRVRAPYILPFVDVSSRASIPHHNALTFSKKVWKLNVTFWSHFPHVKVRDTEFKDIALRYGIDPEENMRNTCLCILRRLEAIPEREYHTVRHKGMIWLDLNGTLITSEEGMLSPAVTVDGLQEAIQRAQNDGWDVGICSDSPHEPLQEWGQRHGINGSILSENGLVLNGAPLTGKRVDAGPVRGAIRHWADVHGIAMHGDRLSPEFNGHQSETMTGIAFGAGRVASVSIFCMKSGKPDATITQELGDFLRKTYKQEYDLDVSPPHGFIAIHTIAPHKAKRKALLPIAWALFKRGRRCIMIGDSINDLCNAPALCPVGIVQGRTEAMERADLVATKSATEGTIELINMIIDS